MHPKVSVYFDFNSTYSFLTSVRIYQICNGNSASVKPLHSQYPLSSTDITHPTISKVRFEQKPIEYGVLLAKSGQKGPPITPGSTRANYTWIDLIRTLKKLGLDRDIGTPDSSWWPQKVSFPNRITYILSNRDVFAEGAKELINNYKPENYDSSWRDIIIDSGYTLEEAITSEYVFRVYEKVFFEHVKITDWSVHVDILEKILAKHPSASRGLGGSKTIIELAKNSKTVRVASFKPTQNALELGLFGIPTFVGDGDTFFWGNDHLTDAAINVCQAQKNKSKL
ncbi:hypothetical protein BB559_006184 [Furculomyces boomerangus]|uniref:DSBA-like thioredoxin domain-containing protein n=1 Tax=Furculomyces boomerangus TaxID=61424 RepID=A0A2T9Y4E7_9FUNG|nr:hypothetical protein BB559_006184 [Furculomyces boomerangus]